MSADFKVDINVNKNLNKGLIHPFESFSGSFILFISLFEKIRRMRAKSFLGINDYICFI